MDLSNPIVSQDNSVRKNKLIAKVPGEKIRRTSKMTMIYLCDTTNDTTIELNQFDPQNTTVNEISSIEATIICEITIAGVKNYKSVEKRVIPRYSFNKMVNMSSGSLVLKYTSTNKV